MKSKKKNKNLPLYLFGGNTDDLLSQYLQIQQKRSENPGEIENPNTALADNNIRRVRAEQKAAENPWTTGLDILGNLAMQAGGSMMNKGMSKGQGVSDKGFNWGSLMQQGIGALGIAGQTMATGGIANGVDINAEGKEVVETPNGNVSELKGPSHEGGGIDLNVPPGTEIFSKRLKGPDGKTMAERKKLREKKLSSIKKLYEKNPSDQTLKKTLNKIAASNEMEEKSDLEQMEKARTSFNSNMKMMMGGIIKKYALGGITSPFDFDNYQIPKTGDKPKVKSLNSLKPIGFSNDSMGNMFNDIFNKGGVGTREQPTISSFDNPTYYNTNSNSNNSNDDSLGRQILDNINLGDSVGMIGNLISTFGPMDNTRANRAGDTPNINPFKDFGKDALKTIKNSKDYLNTQRDNALSNIDLSSASQIKRNRNSARGINQMRALDLATNLQDKKAKSGVYSNVAKMMQNILAQQAHLENQQDSAVMKGEYSRDLSDRKDRDNFFSQLAQDIATKGTGLQKIGKDINKVKSRNTTGNVMKSLFDNFYIDPNTGKLTFKSSLKKNKNKKKK